jgi:siroheme synthase (precorrin-2 oxidase/ferrochelatase)
MPAVHRAGPVTVAVSSAGASPALASWLRTRLAAHVGPEVGDLALVLASCRDTLRSRGGSLEDAEWASLIDEELLGSVRDGDDETVAARVRTWLEAQP